MLTQGQIEDAIEETVARLEALTDEYADATHAAAEAEADYRLAYYRTFLRLKDDRAARQSDKACEARAVVAAEDAFRAYKVTAASAEAVKAALRTHSARLDSLRTLAANVRGQT